MFTGEYTQKMDTKGRTIVPAKFREELGTSVVVTRGLDGCLFAYSKEAWHALEEKLSSLPFADRKVRDFNRFFLSSHKSMYLCKILSYNRCETIQKHYLLLHKLKRFK